MSDDISLREARRIALAAQGFARARPPRAPDLGHVRRAITRLGAVQIDAVNVLVRSHYLPVFSRLGPYPMAAFDRLAGERRAIFEYWGHAASFLPIELHPLLRWRMEHHAAHKGWAAVRERLDRERPGYVDDVVRQITERGPLAFTELDDTGRRDKVPTKYAESSLLWYSWSDGKTTLESLFDAGTLAVAGRRGFERLYDLPERVIPPEILALPTPSPADAQRELVRIAAGALGLATVRDLADYFRLPVAVAKTSARDLVEAGSLRAVRVEGWPDVAYLTAGAARTEPVEASALMSPFDSVVWERARTQRLFGFTHSFELYVPAPKRRYGYYVLPFLLGDRLVARVDVKMDRKAGALLVPGAFAEAGTDSRRVVTALAGSLREMAAWLGIDRVEVGDRGDLTPALRGATRARRRNAATPRSRP